MELGGTTLGTAYDHLSVLGTATLGGALNVAYINGSISMQQAVPEPATLAALGLGALALIRRRRRS